MDEKLETLPRNRRRICRAVRARWLERKKKRTKEGEEGRGDERRRSR